MFFQAGFQRGGFYGDFFGPPLWMTLHIMAASFPLGKSQEETERRLAYKDMLISIIKCLPCKDCRENSKFMIKILQDLDFMALTRDQLKDIMYTFHNQVNKKLGKKVLSKAELKQMDMLYETGRTGINEETQRDQTPKCGHTCIHIRHRSNKNKTAFTAFKKSSIIIDKKCF